LAEQRHAAKGALHQPAPVQRAQCGCELGSLHQDRLHRFERQLQQIAGRLRLSRCSTEQVAEQRAFAEAIATIEHPDQHLVARAVVQRQADGATQHQIQKRARRSLVQDQCPWQKHAQCTQVSQTEQIA
jgi:hypothetical protein